MAQRMGIDYVIKIEDSGTPGTFVTLAGQRNGAISFTQDTVEVTSKDSVGWRENEVSFKSYEITGDGLVVDSDLAYEDLMDAFINGTILKVEFAYIGTSGTEKYAGDVIVTALSTDGSFDGEATYSVSLMGTGAVVRTIV